MNQNKEYKYWYENGTVGTECKVYKTKQTSIESYKFILQPNGLYKKVFV